MSAGRAPISELLQMRRSAHQFLVRHAPAFFALQEAFAGPMLMPPSLSATAGAEPMERLVALAADEATRLSHAELFTLDPDATLAALAYGARLQAGAADVAPAGSGKIDGQGIVPPTPAGFLCWATPIIGTSDQMPIIGVHWGRITTSGTWGTWLVRWADAAAVLASGVGDVWAPGLFTPQLADDMLTRTGPVCYAGSSFLQGPDDGADRGPAAFPFTHLRGLAPTTAPTDLLDPDDTLTHIVLASWAMLTPDPAQPARPPHLARHTAPAQEAEADRRAGLPARSATLVTAPTLRPTDPLPKGLDEEFRQLCMRFVALVAPDAPAGPSPDEVIADLLRRYDAEVVVMAAYRSNRQVLRMLADKARTSSLTVLTEMLDIPPADGTQLSGHQAWIALRRLLLAPSPEPTLPPPGISPTDLLRAMGTFQACALMRLAGNQHRDDLSLIHI